METGRLRDEVRDEALRLIDAGGDVPRWEREDPAAARRRRRSLEALAEKLRGPQAKPKKLRRAKPLGVEFDLGDVVHIRPAGAARQALAVVVDHADSYPPGLNFPVVELLAWDGTEPVPDDRHLAAMPVLLHASDVRPEPRSNMWVVSTHRKDQLFGPHIGDVVAKGVERAPSGDYRSGSALADVCMTYCSWPTLAAYIGGEAFARDLAVARETMRAKPSLLRRLERTAGGPRPRQAVRSRARSEGGDVSPVPG